MSITKPFEEGIYLKYSQSEKVKNIELIKHKIIKEVLKSEKISNQIEITTLTDIPAKTGLGSSGSFTACLLKSVYSYKKKLLINMNLLRRLVISR